MNEKIQEVKKIKDEIAQLNKQKLEIKESIEKQKEEFNSDWNEFCC